MVRIMVSTSYNMIHAHFAAPRLPARSVSDQNEKARNRYGIVLSGGVDGYSRLIAWMRVHNHRCMYTWASDYIKGVLECGGWQLVAVDGGTENGVLRDIQCELFGEDAVKVCMSRRNVGIERIWKEVNEHPTHAALDDLYELEQECGYDPSNPVHQTSMWLVYGPIFQVCCLD